MNVMNWSIEFESEFDAEFEQMELVLQDKLASSLRALEELGPSLGRPYVDTLKDSSHSNMKELRFDFDGGVWRVAFAFDRRRSCVVLVAADKRGVNQKRFYKKLITTADRRFSNYLKLTGQ